VDTATVASQLDKELRAAERDMFSGKNDSADEQLKAIAPQIEQLKASDPENSRVRSLESKYARIRKNLDRKLGPSTSTTATPKTPAVAPAAPSGPASEAVAPAAPVNAAVAAPEQAELPRAVQGDVRNASAKLDETESLWAKDDYSGSTVSGLTDPAAIKLDAVEKPLKSAVYYYENILKKCQRTSSPCDPDHPEIASLGSRIAAMQTNVSGLNAELDNTAAANAAAVAQQQAKAQTAEADCEAWNQRMQVFTEGDKALYRCVAANDAGMPDCISDYNQATGLKKEFDETPLAANPCGALNSTLSDLNRYMENFKPRYDRYTEEQAVAKASLGEIVFSKKPINPGNPANLTTQFDAGDHIYGLIRTTRPWSEIYGKDSDADVMVNVKMDGKKIHAQFVKLKSPALMGRQYLVFEVAPDPGEMTAYGDPDREYGFSTPTLRQGPNELTHHLGQLGPGQHTMEFDVSYYGTTWSKGAITLDGNDYQRYASLHEQIAEQVFQSVTLPAAKMTNKTMVAEMESLLENAGWEDIHRINIVDKDWWLDRVSGGDSLVKSRHLAAAALARDDEGTYYKVCTFHQDRLLTGGFGDLYLSHQGDRVPIPEGNIDK
jgi:hypothetical protein